MKNLDRAYWQDALNSFYVERQCGRYDEAVDAFIEAYPEFREFVEVISKDSAKRAFISSLAARFRESDQKEHDTKPPIPEHIRQKFLPFHIDVPPMSPTISAFDGQGRLTTTDASPKQHHRHHRAIKQFHARGVTYRAEAERKWTDLMAVITERLPDVEHPENLPLGKIVELLKEFDERPDGKPQATAIGVEP